MRYHVKHAMESPPTFGSRGTERPLSPGARTGLLARTALTLAAFYAVMAIALLLLAVLLLGELLLVLVLLRFGLAGLMMNLMRTHLALVPVICRGLWLRAAVEYRVPLREAEAPRLFAMISELCQQAGVGKPEAVHLEMHVNAWVQLGGLQRGRGRTELGIGYDLLTGLTQREVRAVIAHEVAHAKLVQRGTNRWFRRGAARTSQVAGGCANLLSGERTKKTPDGLVRLAFRTADWFARATSRQVAACLRQDEFEADRVAAESCGRNAMRSSLLNLEAVGARAALLPWRERVAQVQLGERFSEWLRRELTTAPDRPSTRQTELFPAEMTGPRLPAAVANPYSTHPSLEDRLGALGPPLEEPPTDSPVGIELLVDPDREAERLMIEIQRVTIRQEQRDSQQLERWLRKTRSGAHLGNARALALVVGSLTAISGLVLAATTGVSPGLLLFVGITVPSCALLYYLGGHRDRIPLPVAEYSRIRKVDRAPIPFGPERVRALEDEVGSLFKAGGKARRSRGLAEHAYAALERCDYDRAFVAAHLALKQQPKSVEGKLALAVAAAAFGQREHVTWALRELSRQTNFSTPSTCWGAAWALILIGDLSGAEAFLRDALRRQPANATMLALLAVCESRRGKLNSAVLHAREACTPAPPHREYSKLLIGLLLEAGFPREAEQRLEPLAAAAESDDELKLEWVRLSLMLRRPEAARLWTSRLDRGDQSGIMYVRLAVIYEAARQAESAGRYFGESLRRGHFPEALAGLGRLAAREGDVETARRHFLAALDLKREPAKGSVGSLAMLGGILTELVVLQAHAQDCRAWIATLHAGNGPAALANHSFVIFATARRQAEEHLIQVLMALNPGGPPPPPGSIGWRDAPEEQQPVLPVKPGVQGVFVA